MDVELPPTSREETVLRAERDRKAALRDEMQRRLKALPPAERAARTLHASHTLTAFLLDRVPAGAPIALYAATPTELVTDPVAAALGGRHPLLFPRVEGDHLVFQPGDLATLTAHSSRVREPAPDAPVIQPAAIVVPGRAFDRFGVRLGRGKGYYDRTLVALPKDVLLIGYVFDFQVVPDLPHHAHDRWVHHLVTDVGPARTCAPVAALND